MKKNISRRNFLKLALLGKVVGLLAACKQTVKPVARVVSTLTATPSNIPLSATNSPTIVPNPTATATTTATTTPTEPTLTPTTIPCFRLLMPEDGTQLPALGKVIFIWDAMPDAAHYRIEFMLPSGQVVSFDTQSPRHIRYVETFLLGGVYTWQVVALDEQGRELCRTAIFHFKKPASPTPEPTQQNANENTPTSASDDPPPPVGTPGT